MIANGLMNAEADAHTTRKVLALWLNAEYGSCTETLDEAGDAPAPFFSISLSLRDEESRDGSHDVGSAESSIAVARKVAVVATFFTSARVWPPPFGGGSYSFA